MYLRLTEANTGTPVLVKEYEIKIVTRKQGEEFTTIYFSVDRSNYLEVSESVEEIEKALNNCLILKTC